MDIQMELTFEVLVYEEQGLSIIQCSTNILFFSRANGLHVQGWIGAYLFQLCYQIRLERGQLVVSVIRCLAEFVFCAYSRGNLGQGIQRRDDSRESRDDDQENQGQGWLGMPWIPDEL
ncbi:uncharacterized protein LOC110068696 isoform X2 [Orbicella faveolata]|nr:uncharacterized protein LOC110068696 isoform X2 [Orbicella faveolata]